MMHAGDDTPRSPEHRLRNLMRAYWRPSAAEEAEVLDILGPPDPAKPVFPSTDTSIYRGVPDLARIEIKQQISDERREHEHGRVMRALRLIAIAIMLSGAAVSLVASLAGGV